MNFHKANKSVRGRVGSVRDRIAAVETSSNSNRANGADNRAYRSPPTSPRSNKSKSPSNGGGGGGVGFIKKVFSSRGSPKKNRHDEDEEGSDLSEELSYNAEHVYNDDDDEDAHSNSSGSSYRMPRPIQDALNSSSSSLCIPDIDDETNNGGLPDCYSEEDEDSSSGSYHEVPSILASAKGGGNVDEDDDEDEDDDIELDSGIRSYILSPAIRSGMAASSPSSPPRKSAAVSPRRPPSDKPGGGSGGTGAGTSPAASNNPRVDVRKNRPGSETSLEDDDGWSSSDSSSASERERERSKRKQQKAAGGGASSPPPPHRPPMSPTKQYHHHQLGRSCNVRSPQQTSRRGGVGVGAAAAASSSSPKTPTRGKCPAPFSPSKAPKTPRISDDANEDEDEVPMTYTPPKIADDNCMTPKAVPYVRKTSPYKKNGTTTAAAAASPYDSKSGSSDASVSSFSTSFLSSCPKTPTSAGRRSHTGVARTNSGHNPLAAYAAGMKGGGAHGGSGGGHRSPSGGSPMHCKKKNLEKLVKKASKSVSQLPESALPVSGAGTRAAKGDGTGRNPRQAVRSARNPSMMKKKKQQEEMMERMETGGSLLNNTHAAATTPAVKHPHNKIPPSSRGSSSSTATTASPSASPTKTTSSSKTTITANGNCSSSTSSSNNTPTTASGDDCPSLANSSYSSDEADHDGPVKEYSTTECAFCGRDAEKLGLSRLNILCGKKCGAHFCSKDCFRAGCEQQPSPTCPCWKGYTGRSITCLIGGSIKIPIYWTPPVPTDSGGGSSSNNNSNTGAATAAATAKPAPRSAAKSPFKMGAPRAKKTATT